LKLLESLIKIQFSRGRVFPTFVHREIPAEMDFAGQASSQGLYAGQVEQRVFRETVMKEKRLFIKFILNGPVKSVCFVRREQRLYC
jgi:hypothetical protein